MSWIYFFIKCFSGLKNAQGGREERSGGLKHPNGSAARSAGCMVRYSMLQYYTRNLALARGAMLLAAVVCPQEHWPVVTVLLIVSIVVGYLVVAPTLFGRGVNDMIPGKGIQRRRGVLCFVLFFTVKVRVPSLREAGG